MLHVINVIKLLNHQQFFVVVVMHIMKDVGNYKVINALVKVKYNKKIVINCYKI